MMYYNCVQLRLLDPCWDPPGWKPLIQDRHDLSLFISLNELCLYILCLWLHLVYENVNVSSLRFMGPWLIDFHMWSLFNQQDPCDSLLIHSNKHPLCSTDEYDQYHRSAVAPTAALIWFSCLRFVHTLWSDRLCQAGEWVGSWSVYCCLKPNGAGRGVTTSDGTVHPVLSLLLPTSGTSVTAADSGSDDASRRLVLSRQMSAHCSFRSSTGPTRGIQKSLAHTHTHTHTRPPGGFSFDPAWEC